MRNEMNYERVLFLPLFQFPPCLALLTCALCLPNPAIQSTHTHPTYTHTLIHSYKGSNAYLLCHLTFAMQMILLLTLIS